MTRAMHTCTDPTREEMLAYLASIPGIAEFDSFDIEEATYWFASDWHGGQWSSLYIALSASPFTPGINANAPGEPAGQLYDELEAHYTTRVAPRVWHTD
jgi:hypothetical protein